MKRRLVIALTVAFVLAATATYASDEGIMQGLCATFSKDSWEWYWFLCYLY